MTQNVDNLMTTCDIWQCFCINVFVDLISNVLITKNTLMWKIRNTRSHLIHFITDSWFVCVRRSSGGQHGHYQGNIYFINNTNIYFCSPSITSSCVNRSGAWHNTLINTSQYKAHHSSHNLQPQGVCILWKRISVMVCEKSAYPNCSGRVITAPEDL